MWTKHGWMTGIFTSLPPLPPQVFPYFSVNDATKPHSVRSAGALASPTAFGLALDILCAFEAGGSGLQWSDLRSEVRAGGGSGCGYRGMGKACDMWGEEGVAGR